MNARRPPSSRRTAVWKSATPNVTDALWMTRLEMLQGIRHEMRGTIDTLAAILAQLGMPRLPPAKIPDLVRSAERNLQSLSELTDSLRVLATDVNPTPKALQENLHDIAKAAIATLAHATRGIRIRLRANQDGQLMCDRRMVEFLVMSLLMLLLKALRNDRSRADIEIVIEDDKEEAAIEMRFYPSPRWSERESEDAAITWKTAIMLIANCGGSIEPRELSQLRERLRISFAKH